MKGLYAIVDTKVLAERGTDPIEFARAVLASGPCALQLRAKDQEARSILGLLRALGPMCRQARVPLVANDRADLAALAGCDAVHIGQEDLPYPLVHRIAPQLAVGISVHDLEQLERALGSQPRYVGYGPIFAIPSKPCLHPAVGTEALATASKIARAAGVSLVAMGGITLANIAQVAMLADACAVVGDLYPDGATLGDVRERAHAIQLAIATARGETSELRPTTPFADAPVRRRTVEGT